MTSLRLSPDLALPLEAVTETIAILAKRGAGKSYTASVLVEEMLEQRLQVVVVDPMGAWHGLRSSADGRGPGYPIAILGGDHGDVPLEATGGAVVADLVVDERLSAILDLSAFSKNDRRRFVTDCLERLYHRNRDAMHVVLEEADLFAPQRPMAGDERMLGAVYDLVRRGRGRGLGSTLITQRSASLSKEVLEQAEVLVALRTTGPRDRAAIKAWIDVHGEEAERDAVMGSLPSLPTGTAWVWWPVEGVLRQVRIRARRTFDSSATPRPGEARRAPRTVADVDLAALRTRMAATIERARADDPKALRRRIAELEREMQDRPVSRPEVRIERVEVPVLDGQVDDLRALVHTLSTVGEQLVAVGAGITSAIERVSAQPPTPMKLRVAEVDTREQHGRSVRGPSRAEAKVRALPPAPRPASEGEVSLGRAERTFLAALVQYPRGLTRTRLSLITGYRAKSGHFANVLGRLRSLGLVASGSDPIVATPEGIAAAGDVEPLPAPGEELVAYWIGRLGKAEAAFLAALAGAWPESLSRSELAEQTGYREGSGHFANVLGRLRGLGLVDGWRASDELMGGS